jgi:predicted Zn finger-like uncharacterized protein
MPIKVTCPACDAAYTLAEDKAGKDVRCRRCNETISVPDPNEERQPRRKSESSGYSPLFWILGITLGVFLLLFCGAVTAVGIFVYGIANAANRIVQNMPGAEPKDMNEALRWLSEGSFKAENAAAWLENQPVDLGRRAEVVRALEKAYQTQSANPFARDKFLNALVAWAGPNDAPILIRSLDNGMNMNYKVLDFLARNPTEDGARAVARQMNGLGFFKASDTLKKMGPTAEDAVADLTVTGKDGTVKVEACRILEVIGTKKSVAKVRQAMQRDPILQYNGEQAIQKMQNR